MKKPFQPARRRFLKESSGLLGLPPLLPSLFKEATPGSRREAPGSSTGRGSSAQAPSSGPERKVWVVAPPGATVPERLAAAELARGLRNLGFSAIQAPVGQATPRPGETVFRLAANAEIARNPEAFEIAREVAPGDSTTVRLSGATPQAVLYAVFDFLERQGAYFGLDGEIYPLDPIPTLNLPPSNQPWQSAPRFEVRGLVPWPDFLNCITVFNREDLRAYLEAMLRMRFNTLGIHVYSGANQWAESFLSFEYANAGHLAFTDTSATQRWGSLPMRTSRYGMGASDFYDSEVFGSDATTQARDCWEAAERAQQLWREAFEYAYRLGIRTGMGFEPYQIPDEIFRATPPEARSRPVTKDSPGARLDPESVAARDILETRLARLLEAYPTVDYVWLWEDEDMSWASQKSGVPLSLTPFRQAHDFLRRHAPRKRLVISGWGGVVRHFAAFHRALPEDIIFSSLSDNLGWDPVSEEFARLEGRERWPIPWLEDDPAMWLPQFHVHRFVRDMDRAADFGCQGLLGIHWRHRIMDINAGFQARYSWEKTQRPEEHYRAYTIALIRPPAAEKVANLLNQTDRDRRILCSFTGEVKDDHHQIHEYSGDYDEAFQFWNGYEPPAEIKISQKQVAQELRALTAAATTAEGERLNYLTRHIEFLTPYAESWSLAYRLHQVLQQAVELKKSGKAEEAREKVRAEGVPLWLKLAPFVREALLDLQEIVSTRNDLGSLASMHNKYERLALFRLRASMKEFLGELPPEVERLCEDVRRPNPSATERIFIPTRPTILQKGESVRIFAVAVAPTKKVRGVQLKTRPAGTNSWTETALRLSGRRTYEGELKTQTAGPGFLDYYVEATLSGGANADPPLTAPLEAPHRFYTVTLA